MEQKSKILKIVIDRMWWTVGVNGDSIYKKKLHLVNICTQRNIAKDMTQAMILYDRSTTYSSTSASTSINQTEH